MSKEQDSVLNTDVIRDHLDQRVREGLSPAESAGEEMFMKNKMVDMGALARGTRQEAEDIIKGWLEERIGAEGNATAWFVAERYASFMGEKLPTFDLSSHPMDQINATRRAWRASAES